MATLVQWQKQRPERWVVQKQILAVGAGPGNFVEMDY